MKTRTVRLGDVADFLTGFPFKSRDYSKDDSGIRLLRGDNIGQGFLRWDAAKLWPHHSAGDYDKFELEPGDVVLAMDRPWIEAGLKYSVVNEEDLPALLVQRVTRLRGTESLDTGYLRYLIGSQEFTEHVHTVSTGTAVPHISGRDILAFEFELPEIEVQKEIARTLGTLDEKIELNRRMSATLEEMARALYRSWFVDFDPVHARALGQPPAHMDATTAALFPDRFGPDGLPKDWEWRSLDDIADFLNGAALQKFPPIDGEESLPVIKIAELRSGITPKSNRAGRQVPQKYKIVNGDVLFSWSGSLLQKVWTEGPGALNQHLFKVTSQVVPKWFHFFAVDQHMEEFRQVAASKATTMGHIQRHHLKEAMVAMPRDQAVIEAAGKVIGPAFDRAVAADLENQTLATLRDSLLPRLMSGELRIREAEKQVEELVSA